MNKLRKRDALPAACARQSGLPGPPSQQRTAIATARKASCTAAASILLLAAVYLIAVRTGIGQRFENTVWLGAGQTAGQRPAQAASALNLIGNRTATAAVAVVFLIGLVRRQVALAVAGAGVISASVATAEYLKGTLIRPNLVPGWHDSGGNSFPSGHAAMAMAVMFALVLVAPYRIRGVVASCSAALTSEIGALTIVARWHRLSDTLGADLIVLCYASLAILILATLGRVRPAEPHVPRGRKARGPFVLRPLTLGTALALCGAAIYAALTCFPFSFSFSSSSFSSSFSFYRFDFTRAFEAFHLALYAGCLLSLAGSALVTLALLRLLDRLDLSPSPGSRVPLVMRLPEAGNSGTNHSDDGGAPVWRCRPAFLYQGVAKLRRVGKGLERADVAGSDKGTKAAGTGAETAGTEPVSVSAAAAKAGAAGADEGVLAPDAAVAIPVPAVASAGQAADDAAGEPLPHKLNRRKALLFGGVGVLGGAAAVCAAGRSRGSQNVASGGGGGTAGGVPSASAPGRATPAVPAVPDARISTVPADGATDVDPSKPVTVRVHGGTIESVALSGQKQANGTLSTDRSSWTSDNVLSTDTSYTLAVRAKNPAGRSTTSLVSFGTLVPSATFGVGSVVPPHGSTVGVGQPIRVTFTNYVPAEYRAALEKACLVTTNPPIAGAWYWVSNGADGAIVDWRPETFWPVNTKVTVSFNLDGVRLGAHQFGVENHEPHMFTISDRDLRLVVDKDEFRATCYENGQVVKTFPIGTGKSTAETFVTYTGTMSVLGKGNPVEMRGDYGPDDTYDEFVNWATHITWSGTYVHAAPRDPDVGRLNVSHGCVHCRPADAEWFYTKVITGDVVTITGSRKRPVAVDNGICTFTLDWQAVLKGSASGPTLNGKPVAA